MPRNEQQLYAGQAPANLNRCIDSVQQRHRYIQNCQIGFQPKRFLYRCPSILRRSDALKMRFQERTHPFQCEWMIVSQQYTKSLHLDSRPKEP